MPILIAQGPRLENRQRHPLIPDEPLILGQGPDAWSVGWEPFLSRRHAELVWKDNRLRVTRIPEARNPIWVEGERVDRCELQPGGHFVIGQTSFLVEVPTDTTSTGKHPLLLQERAISAPELQKIPFRDAPHRLDVLSRLPAVISRATDDQELFVRVVDMLLTGIHRADTVALVAIDPDNPEKPRPTLLHWDSRRSAQSSNFRPSRRLIAEAVAHKQQTVLHAWGAEEDDGLSFTIEDNFDWAFCTPVRGDACQGWAIYVTGKLRGDPSATILAPWETNEIGADLKFSELVAAILGSLRQVQVLQSRQASLGHFFSPAVLNAISHSEAAQVLRPRETEVSVLFCDLRGFSRKSEQSADQLMPLLERVSKALGVMTQNILDQGGVIGDFQGDAAMGFWGWPIAQPDKVRRACLAALGIRQMFAASALRDNHPLREFSAGIGVATGTAVAGQIGPSQQMKVSVFGPVVNLASRLEGMTKILRSPILVDEPTAEVIRRNLPPEVARCRRLAKVRPYGMSKTLVVTEVLPPATEYPLLSDEHIACYEEAFDEFLQGNWARAYELLHKVPHDDRGKLFLMNHLIKNDFRPPASWAAENYIPLLSKSG
jgi:adenylate cyclase